MDRLIHVKLCYGGLGYSFEDTIPTGDTYASPMKAKATMKSDDRKKVNIMKAKYMVTWCLM